MTTEENILNAARKVFIRKGFEGARMQEIANEAGINKALLHYYFRTKERLFEQIFSEAFNQIRPAFLAALQPETDIKKFVKTFVASYFTLLNQMPYLPNFVIGELNRDPQRLVKLLGKQQIPVEAIRAMIQREIDNNNMHYIDPRHFMVHTISLIVFPFVARPIITALFLDHNPDAYQQFINARQEEVTTFILRSIEPKNAEA